jgi:putative ABC transport system ATP-binding protein
MSQVMPVVLDERARLSPAIEFKQVRFRYAGGHDILHIPSLIIGRQERIFLYGPSGSGKTTLLGLLAGVFCATEGSSRVFGQDLTTLSAAQRNAFRGVHIGYIFQLFNVIPYLSVEENILLPCRLHRKRRARLDGQSLQEAVREAAGRLGFAHLLPKRVTDLSVGEQQRVAAARALVGMPELILADEPTSSLSFDHRERFLNLLFECSEEAGSTLIFVSHDRTLMPMFQRALSLPEVNHVQAG